MPSTVWNAMSANNGVPQMNGNDQMAIQSRQMAMGDWQFRASLAAQQAQLQAQLAMNGTFGQRSAADAATQSRDFAGRGALQQGQLAGEGSLQNLRTQGALATGQQAGEYGLQAARIGNEPQMGALALQGREYDDVAPARRAQANADAAFSNFRANALGGAGGQPGGQPSGGAPGQSGGLNADQRAILGLPMSMHDQLAMEAVKAAAAGGDSDAVNSYLSGGQMQFSPHLDQRSAQDFQTVVNMPSIQSNLQQLERYLGDQNVNVTDNNIKRAQALVQQIRSTASAARISPRAMQMIENEIRQKILSAKSKIQDMSDSGFLTGLTRGYGIDKLDALAAAP